MFKRALIAIVAVLVIASIYLSNLVSDPEPPRHQVFLNGEVLTMDPANSISEAVSVRGGRIESVGTSEEIST